MRDAIALRPRVRAPRRARVGERHLLVIDLDHALPVDEWPYPAEEYPVDCFVDAAPLFTQEALDGSTIVVHRYGGSYGPAVFQLTARAPGVARIRVTLVNRTGRPVVAWTLDDIEIAAAGERALVELDAGQLGVQLPSGRSDQATRGFRWLHLSDLHCDGKTRRSHHTVAQDVVRLLDRDGPLDAVIVTGDLTLTASPNELEQAGELLFSIRHDIADRQGRWPPLVVVPGNHDVDLRRSNEYLRLVREWDRDPAIAREFWSDRPSPLRDEVWQRFADYDAWRYQVQSLGGNQRGFLPGEFAASLDANGLRVGFVGLNDSFLHYQGGRRDAPELALDRIQLDRACGEAIETWAARHDVRFLLTHHPERAVRGDDRAKFYGSLGRAGTFTAHLAGSEHGREHTARHELLWQWQVLPCNGRKGQGYAVGELRPAPDGHVVRMWPRRGDGRRMGPEDPRDEVKAHPLRRAVPVAADASVLATVYVPRRVDEEADRLLEQQRWIVVHGPRRSGRTALLKHAAARFGQRGGDAVFLPAEAVLARGQSSSDPVGGRALALLQALRDACRAAGPRTAIFVDDVDHLVDGPRLHAVLADLRPHAGKVALCLAVEARPRRAHDLPDDWIKLSPRMDWIDEDIPIHDFTRRELDGFRLSGLSDAVIDAIYELAEGEAHTTAFLVELARQHRAAPGQLRKLVEAAEAAGRIPERLALRDREGLYRYADLLDRNSQAVASAALNPVAQACACVAIGDGKWQTAFLVEPQVLATQFFMPADARIRDVILDGVGRAARILRPHPTGGVVLLQLEEPVDIDPVELAPYEPSMGADWTVYGYCGPGHDRIVFEAALLGASPPPSLISDEMKFAPVAPQPDDATIGSPVVIGGRVVAWVTRVKGDRIEHGGVGSLIELLQTTRQLERSLTNLASARLAEPARADQCDRLAQEEVAARRHYMFGTLQIQQYWQRDTPTWRIAALVASRVFPPHDGAGLLDIVTSALRVPLSPFEFSTARATAQELRHVLRPTEREQLDRVLAGLDAMAEVDSASPWGRLDGLFAPDGRSIFDKSADDLMRAAVQKDGPHVVQVVGGTGHQRSGLVRRLAEAFADNVIYARTFEWGAPFPEDLAPLLNRHRQAIVILDRVDCLDQDGRRRMTDLLILASQHAPSSWLLVTAAEPIDRIAGESTRTISLLDLPRDRELRRFLFTEFEPEPRIQTSREIESLALWGVDTVVAVVLSSLRLLNPSISDATRAVVDWLQCPCAHHAKPEVPPSRAAPLIRLIGFAQEGPRSQFTTLASRTISLYLSEGRDPVRTAMLMRQTVLGDDTVRLIEARQRGLISAYVELELPVSASGTRPLFSLRPDIKALRSATGDPELDLFYSDATSRLGREQRRVLIETTRAGFAELLRMYRRGQLETLAEHAIAWIAEREPSTDLEDPNRGRFGGLPNSDGISLRARVVRPGEGLTEVEVEVEIERPERLFTRAHREILDGDGRRHTLPAEAARFSMVLAVPRRFTVAARIGTTSVELDLAAVRGFPEHLVHPPQDRSAIPLEPGTTWLYRGNPSDSSGATVLSSTMSIIEAHALESSRPVILALVHGHPDPHVKEPWLLVRYGHLYFQLRGDAKRFEALRDGTEPLESVLSSYHNLIFRFPVRTGDILSLAPDGEPGWSCDGVTLHGDGLTSYRFVHTTTGGQFTVVDRVGLTYYTTSAVEMKLINEPT